MSDGYPSDGRTNAAQYGVFRVATVEELRAGGLELAGDLDVVNLNVSGAAVFSGVAPQAPAAPGSGASLTNRTYVDAASVFTQYAPIISGQLEVTPSVVDARYRHHGPAQAGTVVEVVASFTMLFTGAGTAQFEMSLPFDTSTPDNRAAGQVQCGPNLTNGVVILDSASTAQVMVGNPGLAIVSVANVIFYYIRA
jgi:hypothetical protein